MDNEKYGIELELLTSKFKEKMQEVKSSFAGLSNKKININANTAQIEYIKSQIKEMEYLLSRADKGFEVGDTLKLEASLERLKNKYNDLIAKQNELSSSSTKSHTNMSKGLDKMTSKIKRFGLALLSIRSIYALVSRASSAYLSQDTELANKLQSVWAGLGALLAPIIEGIVNILMKAVAYINIFVKAMTGVDLIAKASAKSMKSATGSAKALNKALAGFDELNNLDTDAGGGAGAGFGGLGALEDIDLPWADKIRKIGEWVGKQLKGTWENMKLFGKFVWEQIKGTWENMKTFGKFVWWVIEQTWENMKTFAKFVWEVIQQTWDNMKLFANWIIGQFIGAWNNLKFFVSEIWNWIKEQVQGTWDNMKLFGSWIGSVFTKTWEGIKLIVTIVWNWIKEQVQGTWDNMKLFGNWIGSVFTGLWDGIKNGASRAWSWITSQLQGTKENFRTFINKIGEWFSKLWNGVLRGFASIWNKVADTVNKVGGKLGMTTLPKINSYAVGTNYVPEDQLAFIHKGEAVVPKKYNNGGYVPQSNDETNYLLEQVINAINNIEINPYTTVKDVGRASLNYINSKSRQLGESVVV